MEKEKGGLPERPSQTQWMWGSGVLGSALDLFDALNSPIEFPLPKLAWGSKVVASPDEIEAWMNRRSFVGVGLRDGGWWWQCLKVHGEPKGSTRQVELSDASGLWKELSEIGARFEAGEIGLAAAKPAPSSKAKKASL